MRNLKFFKISALLGALIFCFPKLLFGWAALSNPPSVWPSLPVPYYVNSSGCADIGGFDPAVQVCETSFDSWENAPCTSWKVNYLGSTSASPMNSSDSLHVLGWVESGWSYGREAIGVTMVYYGGGVIWNADIAFNAQDYTWSLTGGSGYTVDAQSIVTHEEGHFLGLNDLYSCLPDPQTMCGYYSGGTYARTLTNDDIQGVCTLYPGTGPQPECTTDAECDVNYHCVDQKCVGGMCASCTNHDDCGGPYDYCLAFPDGKQYCGVNCTANTECGSGGLCVDLGGGLKQCVPGNFDCVNPAPGCTVDADCGYGYSCQSGVCVPNPNCTLDSDCPAGYMCSGGTCVPDTRPHKPVCSECVSDDECGWSNDRCITFYPDGSPFANGLSYCGVSCDSVGGNCGEGFKCFEFPDKPAQCLPVEHACDTCDPLTLEGCEQEGTYCDFVNCFNGICKQGTAGEKEIGDRCEKDTDCKSLQCVKQVNDSFCSATCSFQPGWDQCSAWVNPNFMCQPRDFGACGYCSCAAGRLGDSCNSDSDCQSGGCFMAPDGSGKICSYMCSAMIKCPSYFSCKMAGDNAVWGCFPDVLTPGQPCTEGALCLGGWCDTSLGYCTRSCDGNCQCPSNMHCEGRQKDGSSGEDTGTESNEERICIIGAPKSGCGSCAMESGCGSCSIKGEPGGSLILLPSVLFLAFLVVFLARKKQKI